MISRTEEIKTYQDFKWQSLLLWPLRFTGTSADRDQKPETGSGLRRELEQSEGELRLGMKAGAGKISDAGYDQVACWYTRIPADSDVEFTARIRVDAFLKDGAATYQEGFGLFLRDTMDNDPETGYPYANMAAAGGYYGGFNFFGRTGIRPDDIEDPQGFYLNGKKPQDELLRICEDDPRYFRITIARKGACVLADIRDDQGAPLLSAESPVPGGTPGFFTGPDGACCLRVLPETFSGRDRKYLYLGFLCSGGGRITVETDSIRILLSRRKSQLLRSSELVAAPSGSCFGDGTAASPYDLQTAIDLCRAGQEIRVLPGHYELTSALVIRREQSGTADAPKRIRCRTAPEKPAILDFLGTSHALEILADHWEIDGLTVTRGFGFCIQGSHDKIRNCVARDNLETGFLIRHPDIRADRADWPSDDLVEDCISVCNCDDSEHNADGFACKVAAGDGNRFVRCLSALNSDDGFDLFAKNRRIGAVRLEGCISCLNGYRLEADGALRKTAGNGNGFKLGGSGLAIAHSATDCEAFGNKGAGFTSNSNPHLALSGCRSGNNGGRNINYYFTGANAAVSKTIDNTTVQDDPDFDPVTWIKEHLGEGILK
ncbi:MAG: right-handed parallel beta-helix repeat-containing protein [Mogibacterium sp.]|nr:right-handed parallel beta-helix repeat-containing protein [Mogibacterium sp.]